MALFQFEALLIHSGWIRPAYVLTDSHGNIDFVGREKPAGRLDEKIEGFALPGFQNAHSHAFQYAMAGWAERHPTHSRADDFWSWRDQMYQLARCLDPDQIESIAAMAYAEMTRHGYTSVAEFHYLHHDKQGKPYHNAAEHGERLVRAAEKAGIKITLIPVLYQKGGFDQPAQSTQKRFVSTDLDAYQKLLEASKRVVARYLHAQLGFGVHSLRAVEPALLSPLLEAQPKALPFHIHMAEQLKEVQDCVDYLGKRPVQYLLDHVAVDHRFHLVHATHATPEEIKAVSNAGAKVVICPSTEGNLGDGIFPLVAFREQGGGWSIGTDSHIGLNPLEELRLLDYGQRATVHRRDVFTTDLQEDCGTYGFHQALINGQQAMGNINPGYFRKGEPFDAVILDANAPLLSVVDFEHLLSAIVYTADVSQIKGTINSGRWVVREQQNKNREAIASAFQQTMTALSLD